MFASFMDGIRPFLPILVPLAVLAVVLAMPLPGRGPRFFSRRDPWRGFKYGARRIVMERAGGRCEGAFIAGLGRCRQHAVEVDHIYPCSRGGPTIASNGQALCKSHNQRKSNMRPPWWYVRALERRRRAYFPADADLRVLARMSPADLAARQQKRAN